MKLPYMPFWVAVWITDTVHLTAEGSGAYLHLVLHYWANDAQGLPQDDKSLARIARVTDKRWKAIKPVLLPFFKEGWRHSRVEREYALALEKHEKRSRAGKAGGKAKAEAHQSSSIAKAMPQQSSSIATAELEQCSSNYNHNHKEVGGLDDAPMSVANSLTDKLAEICGFKDQHEWPTGWYGAPMRVKSWLDHGWQPKIIETAVRAAIASKRDGPPGSINYFEKAIARAHADAAAPLPIVKVVEATEITHVQQPRRPRVGEGLDRLRARLRAEDDAARDEGACAEQDRGAVEILPPRKTGG